MDDKNELKPGTSEASAPTTRAPHAGGGGGRSGQAFLSEEETGRSAAADAWREPGRAVAGVERAGASAVGMARPSAARGREHTEGTRARRAR